MSDVIAKALERLDEDGSCVGFCTIYDNGPWFGEPLAALIRKAAGTEYGPEQVACCRICEYYLNPGNHAHDCELIAICKAVCGE